MMPNHAVFSQPHPFSPRPVALSTLRPPLRDLSQMMGLASLVREAWVNAGGAGLVMGGGAVRRSCCVRAGKINCRGGRWSGLAWWPSGLVNGRAWVGTYVRSRSSGEEAAPALEPALRCRASWALL